MGVFVVQVFRDWLEQNPIRLYRKQHSLPAHILASMLGVAEYTIQRWEKGTIPNRENMQKLCKVIPNIEELWSKWEKDRPKL